MAQGKSVAFFCEFVSKFDVVCKEYDDDWIQRTRTINTKILALLIWKLVSGKHGSGIVLNEFWCKSLEFLASLSQPMAIASSSFCEARKKLCSSFFKKINVIINEMADVSIEQRWLGHRIFCVDGTKINLPRALRFWRFSIPSGGAYYPQGLVSCLFNLINKTPHDFLFTRNTNELLAAKRLLPSLRKGDVVVYDRAFLSYSMLAFHINSGLHAVFRTKEKNTLGIVAKFLAQNICHDSVVNFYCPGLGACRVRLVSYYIKNKRYCLLTTLIDQKQYSIVSLKEIYHARWGVEEFFKLSKTYLYLENFHAKTRKGVDQEIAAHFTLINLAQIMAKITSLNKQINRHHAINLVVQNLEKLFLSGAKTLKERLLPWVVGIMGRCCVSKRENRSYIRRSRKPINRWQRNISKEWARKQRALKDSICLA